MIETLQKQLEDREVKLTECNLKIVNLEEQLEWFKRQLFGKKSERVVATHQGQLQFDGFESLATEQASTQTIPSHERKQRTSTGKDTIKLPEDLPMETTVIDIPEEDKVCQESGLLLQKIGEEVSHKLAYHPGSYFLKRIIRP